MKKILHKKHVLIFFFVTLGYAAISFAFYFAARSFPEAVTALYTDKLYKIVTLPLKGIASLFKFSVAEILLFVLAGGILSGLVISVIFTVKKKKSRDTQNFSPILSFLLIFSSVAFIVAGNFVWLGGMNYNALSFKEISGYNVKETEVDVLGELCVYLGEKASEARKKLTENEDGIAVSVENTTKILSLSQSGYDALKEEYGDIFDTFTVAPKKAILSELMCYEQISGIFPIVYTESIVNGLTPTASLPHTACHELAHQYGFMQEDEANFIGFLACINNPDPLYVYSGYYTAFITSMSKLYSYDKELWTEIAKTVDAGIFRDSSAENKFWSEYEKKPALMAAVSESVNNTYLQLNNIKDGTHSYGRMVDLLICYFNELELTQNP